MRSGARAQRRPPCEDGWGSSGEFRLQPLPALGSMGRCREFQASNHARPPSAERPPSTSYEEPTQSPLHNTEEVLIFNLFFFFFALSLC